MGRNPTHGVIKFPVSPRAFLALLGERFKPETQLFNIDKKYFFFLEIAVQYWFIH